MPAVSFQSIPQSRPDDHQPFVLGPVDTSPNLTADGVELRRGATSVSLDVPLSDGFALRGVLLAHGNASFVAAYTGPLITEWWNMLAQARSANGPPLLTAGVQERSVRATKDGIEVPVRIASPPPEPGGSVAAVVGMEGGIDDENLAFACRLFLPVAKCALELMGEYEQLVGTPPDINIAFENGQSLSLSTLLEACHAVAQNIDWTLH